MVHMDPYPLEFMVQSSLDLETASQRHRYARGLNAAPHQDAQEVQRETLDGPTTARLLQPGTHLHA